MKGIFPLIIVILFQLLLSFLSFGSFYIMKETPLILGVPSSMILLILLNIVSLFIIAWIYKKETSRRIQLTEHTHEKEFHSLVTSVRSDRHDFNNHLTVISGLLKIGHYRETENYVKDLIGDIQVNNQVLQITNPILASVLFTKMERFKRNQIVTTLTILSEDVTNILSSTDFIRLMSNLLDNAYEATMELPVEQRRIFLEMKKINEKHIIEVKNSSTLENFDETFFEMEHSTKQSENSRNRGFGLSIIKEITDKYNGELKVTIEEKLVCFTIVFPTRKHGDGSTA
jgi:two-component system, LytTR family, sensor histidine kinase AgrC